MRAKQLLNHALAYSAISSPVAPFVAIHGLDNAVEWTLKILALHLDFDCETGGTFPTSELASMAGELDKLIFSRTHRRLPYVTEIKTLRQVRNLAQHGAIHPGVDLAQHSTVARRFFDTSVSMVFGIDPAALNVSTLVSNETVRAHLEKAEKAIAAKQYLEATVAARNAFDCAFYPIRASSRVRLVTAPVLVSGDSAKFDIYRLLGVLADELEATRLGIDASRYDRFREIIDHLPSGGAWGQRFIIYYGWVRTANASMRT